MTVYIKARVPVRPGDIVRVCVNSLWRGTLDPGDVFKVPTTIRDHNIVYGTLNTHGTVLAVITTEANPMVLILVGPTTNLCWAWPDWLEQP